MYVRIVLYNWKDMSAGTGERYLQRELYSKFVKYPKKSICKADILRKCRFTTLITALFFEVYMWPFKKIEKSLLKNSGDILIKNTTFSSGYLIAENCSNFIGKCVEPLFYNFAANSFFNTKKFLYTDFLVGLLGGTFRVIYRDISYPGGIYFFKGYE